MSAKSQPIIIIKKKGGHGGHHGGAWKVAYADFVTAMMALFIVLWLMGSSEKVKKAVAGYFNDPRGVNTLIGTTMTNSGDEPSQSKSDNALQKFKEKIEQEIKAQKDLNKLSKQISITTTPEGVRIELIEGKNGTFYELGSAKLSSSGQELLALLARELKTLPNSLLIEGYTDAAKYSNDASYGNWELSADRANSARRLMQADGVRQDQVTQVRGYGDMNLRVPSNPFDPSNRRVSILVQNATGPNGTLSAESVVKGLTPLLAGEHTAAPAAGGARPATAPNPAKPPAGKPAAGKPAPATAAAKPSFFQRLKNLLPGKKK